jgi:F-type H+-transporting ATPase subunit delta
MDPVARRYAQALYEEALQTGAVDAVDADVALVGETLSGSRDLALMLASPVVARPRKAAVLAALFEDRLSALSLRFLHLLVDKAREQLIPAVVDAYRALRDERLGVVEATVRSARPLPAPDADRLRATLEARVGATVRLRFEVDPALIGGLVVQLGDVVYDRSVHHQLQTLRDTLLERAALSAN